MRRSSLVFVHYLRRFAWLAAGLSIVVVVFNRLVDPYDLHPVPRPDSINSGKPQSNNHVRLFKTEAIRRIRPVAIALGNSRTDKAIDPLHPGWGARPVYNLGIPSAFPYEIYRYLEHAQAVHPLRIVVLVVDVFMFHTAWHVPPDFSEERLAVDAGGKRQPFYWNDAFATLFSLDATLDSVKTLEERRRSTHLSDGMFDSSQSAENIRNSGGYRKVFLVKEKDYLHMYSHLSFTGGEHDNWQEFRNILKFAHQNRIDLRIAIAPTHARLFEVFDHASFWPLLEQWERNLVRINEEMAQQMNGPPFPLWDFSNYNVYTTESVPPLGDIDTKMRWYWEDSHYTKELGDLMLDRIFDHHEAGRDIAKGFGVLLSLANIEQHLAATRSKRESWVARSGQDIAEMEKMRVRPLIRTAPSILKPR